MTPSEAWADDVSDAQATLEQAEERLTQISQEHAKLQEEAEGLQTQIDAAIEGVMDAQSEVQEGREHLGEMLSREYKTGGIGLLTVLFESENLNELVNNLHYLDAVQQAQADEIELQRQRQEAFNTALDDLNTKKDEQMKKISEAEQKTAEAAQVVSNAETKLADAKDAAAEAERLAELKAQAEALAKEQEEKQAAVETPAEPEPETPSQSESTDNNGAGSNTDNAGSNAGNSGGSSSGGNAGGSSDSQTGWKTGSASAYGSESDGTLGGRTATGAIVTESSMGVAVPLSWSNARSYLGRQVEISYGGMTVIATVNDLGAWAAISLSRFATRCMARVRRKLVLRLGRAYGELPLPVGCCCNCLIRKRLDTALQAFFISALTSFVFGHLSAYCAISQMGDCGKPGYFVSGFPHSCTPPYNRTNSCFKGREAIHRAIIRSCR
ncbi:MAG: coiled-coil domain-containing protein [Slackia sp.]